MNVWFRQIFLFGVIGVVQVAIDSGVLIGLSALGVSIVISNVVGRISGACAGFFLNGTATFSSQTNRRLHGQHLTRFIVNWVALTLVSTSSLYLLSRHISMEATWLAKPAVELFLAFISFFISKFWIYT